MTKMYSESYKYAVFRTLRKSCIEHLIAEFGVLRFAIYQFIIGGA